METIRIFDYHHARPTPWGKADKVFELGLGFVLVGTPSHGGIMIGKKQAEEFLSQAAINRGQIFNQFLCYEEDSLEAIVLFEHPELWFKYRATWTNEIRSIEKIKQAALKRLSRWNADYLLERGIEPEPESEDGDI